MMLDEIRRAVLLRNKEMTRLILTERELKIARYIHNNRGPFEAQPLADVFGVPSPVMYKVLDILVNKGYVVRDKVGKIYKYQPAFNASEVADVFNTSGNTGSARTHSYSPVRSSAYSSGTGAIQT